MAQARPVHPLRRWRLAAGLTLQAAADRVGTSRQVWSDWERGRRRPSGVFMPKVRSATGGKVTADDFYCGKPAAPAMDEAA